jgi:tRNA-modifying protein YgfZ
MNNPNEIAPHSSSANAHTSSAGSVVVFDLSDRTQIELVGGDRAKFLQGFCTNDIKSLQPGQGCEGFLTNIKGRVLAHLFVFAGKESLWLDTVPGQEAVIIAHLDRYIIREDVQLIGRSNDRGELLVCGTHAAQLLMLDNGLPMYGSVERQAFGQSFDIRRVDLLGPPGFLLSVPRSALETTRQSLRAVGCVAGSRDEFESRRIEAGFPCYGIDITEENIAQEVARTKQCISFTKGCYLGQEPIARLDAMGHTNRELRRIRFDAARKPAVGATLLAADGDDEAGLVTSVAPLANDAGQTMALGYLKTKFGRANTIVRVQCDGAGLSGTVLPPT